MGTNYYAKRHACATCGRGDEPWHIGKSSAGWRFHWNGYGHDEDHPRTVAEWWAYLEANPDCIEDEYGKAHTLAEFRAWVEAKKGGVHTCDGYVGPLDADDNYITTEWEFS